MRRTLVALAAVPAVLATPARAEPTVLKPQSPWNVNFGEDRCRLSRLFSDGSNEHLLYFEQHYPSRASGIAVAGRAFRHFDNRARTKVGTADDRAPVEAKPYKGETERFGDTLIYSTLNLANGEEASDLPGLQGSVPMLDTAFAQTAKYLSFRQGSREVRFETGPMGEAFKVLNQCSLSLIEAWGLDVEQHRTARRLPKWINDNEVARKIGQIYPSAAASKGEQGILRMRVIVDETGAPQDCVIIKATVADKLESPACRLMQQARFEPALDAQGQPMRSYYATTVTYQMP